MLFFVNKGAVSLNQSYNLTFAIHVVYYGYSYIGHIDLNAKE